MVFFLDPVGFFFLEPFSFFSCRKKVNVSTRVTTKLDDSIFYIFSEHENPQHCFFRCVAASATTLSAKILTTGPAKDLSGTSRITLRQWSRVGVYNYIGEDGNVVEIPRPNVTGKALIVDGFLITLPDPILQEAWLNLQNHAETIIQTWWTGNE